MGNLTDIILNSVDLDAASKDIAENMLLADDYSLQCRYTWDIDAAEESVDFDNPDVAAAFKIFVNNYAEERANEAMWDLISSLDVDDDGLIYIWRSIIVPSDWVQNGLHERPVGICWSFMEAAAEAHWGERGEGMREVVLAGRVSPDDVDWQESVCLNAHSEEERELRLKSTAVVTLASITWEPKSRHNKTKLDNLDLVVPAGQAAFLVQGAPTCEFSLKRDLQYLKASPPAVSVRAVFAGRLPPVSCNRGICAVLHSACCRFPSDHGR